MLPKFGNFYDYNYTKAKSITTKHKNASMKTLTLNFI